MTQLMTLDTEDVTQMFAVILYANIQLKIKFDNASRQFLAKKNTKFC